MTSASQSGTGPHFAIDPPIEPMLAKLADDASRRRISLRAEVGRIPRDCLPRRRPSVFIQSRDLRPLDRYFPELHDVLCREAARRLRCRRRDRHRDGEGPRFRRAADAAASRGVAGREAREGDAVGVRRVRSAGDRRPRSARRAATPNDAWRSKRRLPACDPPIHLTPMTRDRDAGCRVAGALRGRGAGRCDREARARALTSLASAR